MTNRGAAARIARYRQVIAQPQMIESARQYFAALVAGYDSATAQGARPLVAYQQASRDAGPLLPPAEDL